MRLLTLLIASALLAHAGDMGTLRKLSENKLGPIPAMPACVMGAATDGDPAKGPSTVVFKAAAGCKIPWHWHTPTEQVMIVSGSAKVEMKGGPTSVLGPGGYAKMPSKHVHQFTCTTACTAFVASDATFDIHYVDTGGKEIPSEKALATGK